MALEAYYRCFFPFNDLYRFFTVFDVFEKREISFTFANDVYSRYRSYKTWEEWRNDTIRSLPVKIDIGAVYHHRVAHPKRDPGLVNLFHAKEFVIDIDMPDTKSIITVCKDPAHPDYLKSWRFMRIAVECIDRRLRADYGFEVKKGCFAFCCQKTLTASRQYIMWVFSGRKGVQAWVADPRARQMQDDVSTSCMCCCICEETDRTTMQARIAVAKYLAVDVVDMVRIASMGTDGFNEARFRSLLAHPSLDVCDAVIEPQFLAILGEQKLLCVTEQEEKSDARTALNTKLEYILTPVIAPTMYATLHTNLSKMLAPDKSVRASVADVWHEIER